MTRIDPAELARLVETLQWNSREDADTSRSKTFAEAAAAITTLVAERDQAIAHDRQPYPTAEAYELACAARTKWQDRATQAEARLREIETAWTELERYMGRVGRVQYLRDCDASRVALASLDAAIARTEPKP